ncbi:MAG TPA: hypothetical protein VLG50_01415 [Candidatus Saccharimonadales bacterium]|nr:hypothetical protein [Candidatus Saccharimonadales bacterium]
MNNLMFSIVEIFISLIVETIIMGGIFAWITNKASIKMEQKLQTEMKNIEDQNKLIFQELSQATKAARDDIIAELKEVMK